jgi:hypothetical protein
MPLVFRHAQDAAWLYAQMLADRASALVDFDRLRHFQRLLAAHLDGLMAAGEAGRETALDQLKKWKGSGEFFAWSFLELQAAEPDAAPDLLFQLREACPAPGQAEALAWAWVWIPEMVAGPAIEACLKDARPWPLEATIGALGLKRQSFTLPGELWEHEDAGLRAAVCRYAGRLRMGEHISRLYAATTDDQALVRREAAVALLLCGQPDAALRALYPAVRECAEAVEGGEEGGEVLEAERRAQHLARLLGHALPFPCPGEVLEHLSQTLPDYLFLLTLAHHGDPAVIPRLWPHLDQGRPYAARALRVLTLMTGLNPEEAGICLPDDAEAPEPFGLPGRDMDAGLPVPDCRKAEQWWESHKAEYPEGPLIGGDCLKAPEASWRRLEAGPQDQRFTASLHLLRLGENLPWLDTRAPIAAQNACCEAIKQGLEAE